jgi:hypothetical protein
MEMAELFQSSNIFSGVALVVAGHIYTRLGPAAASMKTLLPLHRGRTFCYGLVVSHKHDCKILVHRCRQPVTAM